jgi:hypothetical protein
MPQDITAFKVDELDASPAAKNVTVGGLVLPASVMVSWILGLNVHYHLACGQVTLRCEIRAP